MKVKKILFVNDKPPYSSLALKESLDTLLVASAFGQTISVLFLGDGIYQLIDKQNPKPINMKNHSAGMGAFSLYDINDVYVHMESMMQRGISKDDFSIPVKLIEQQALYELEDEQDVILSF